MRHRRVCSTRATQREFVRIIDEQADRMGGLIADLLDAGHIATGTLSVAAEASEVGALVEQARTTFLSGGARHAVHIDLEPDLPRTILLSQLGKQDEEDRIHRRGFGASPRLDGTAVRGIVCTAGTASSRWAGTVVEQGVAGRRVLR